MIISTSVTVIGTPCMVQLCDSTVLSGALVREDASMVMRWMVEDGIILMGVEARTTYGLDRKGVDPFRSRALT